MSAPIETPTSLGAIWIWGRDTGRPVVLIITGLFENEDAFCRAHTHFDSADVFYTHLPGNHSPALREISIPAFGQAVSELIAARFGGRPVLVVGVSAGALVALSIRAPNVNRLVLVEPPLRNQFLWPMLGLRRDGRPDWEAWAQPIFGISADATEERDYTGLLDDLRTPAVVLVGDEPLRPRRSLPHLPSLVDEEARRRLEAHPLVKMIEVPGVGHNVVRFAGRTLLAAMQEAARLSQQVGLAPDPGSTLERSTAHRTGDQ